jgi:hypothetical protein
MNLRWQRNVRNWAVVWRLFTSAQEYFFKRNKKQYRTPRGTRLPLLPLGPGGVEQVSAVLYCGHYSRVAGSLSTAISTKQSQKQ